MEKSRSEVLNKSKSGQLKTESDQKSSFEFKPPSTNVPVVISIIYFPNIKVQS
jgi:hypothetical protein